MNPYAPASTLPEVHKTLTLDWRFLLTVLIGFNPLICTILDRRASFEVAGIAFLILIAVTICAAIRWLEVPSFSLAMYAQFLWVGLSFILLVIRAHFGYLTAIGELLKLDDEWLGKLLFFSVLQCLIPLFSVLQSALGADGETT